MTFIFGEADLKAPATEDQVSQLRKDLAKSDERLKAMDKELQRVAEMVAALYELRYHKAPPPVRRSIRLDEEAEP